MMIAARCTLTWHSRIITQNVWASLSIIASRHFHRESLLLVFCFSFGFFFLFMSKQKYRTYQNIPVSLCQCARVVARNCLCHCVINEWAWAVSTVISPRRWWLYTIFCVVEWELLCITREACYNLYNIFGALKNVLRCLKRFMKTTRLQGAIQLATLQTSRNLSPKMLGIVLLAVPCVLAGCCTEESHDRLTFDWTHATFYVRTIPTAINEREFPALGCSRKCMPVEVFFWIVSLYRAI